MSLSSVRPTRFAMLTLEPIAGDLAFAPILGNLSASALAPAQTSAADHIRHFGELSFNCFCYPN
jgi:hypothetical protein